MSSKRKIPEDANHLDQPTNPLAKRPRKEASNKPPSNAKRSGLGEQVAGGLMIVRKPPSNGQPPPSQPDARVPPPRPPSVQPPHSQPGPSKPTSKSNTSRPPSRNGFASSTKGKERADDQAVDEDVRMMDDEAEGIRQRVRNTPAGKKIDFRFPSQPPSRGNGRGAPPTHSSHHRSQDVDMLEPLAVQETPLSRKNKILRGETPGHRRKSSLSMRGKRISSSFENTGVIATPHTSVLDTSLYKHIDADLPEAHRARQLLIWCANRAMTGNDNGSTPRKPKPSTSNDPPPLPADGEKVLRKVEEDLIRMLAEGKIDTGVAGPDSPSRSQHLKPNAQNEKNKVRAVNFANHIERAKAEEAAWAEVTHFYNSHQASVVAGLGKKTPSSKAKGKQRATSQDLEELDVRDHELPQQFRIDGGLNLARTLLEESSKQPDPLAQRMTMLENTVDRLHAIVNSAAQTVHVASSELDRRFASLSLSLASRATHTPHTLHPPSTSAHPPHLSAYLPPPAQGRPLQTTDPQDLLRALSRVDAARPQGQVGDAARRAAREVRRMDEAGVVGAGERRLTGGVVPPTPRKPPPGTPRRAGTPGRKT